MSDLFNSLIELTGSLFVWMNVVKLWQQRTVKGVYWPATGFFALWGVWNLYYYPSLGQWYSFAAGMFIVLGNTTWLILLAWVSWKSNVQR